MDATVTMTQAFSWVYAAAVTGLILGLFAGIALGWYSEDRWDIVRGYDYRRNRGRRK